MDKKLRVVLSKLFDGYCFSLTETGFITPTYFLVKDEEIIKIKNRGMDQELYVNLVLHQATQQDVEALIFVTENNVVTGYKNEQDIQALMNGNIKINDHPNSESYLILMYISKDGNREGLFGKIEQDPSGLKFIKNHEWVTDINQTAHIA